MLNRVKFTFENNRNAGKKVTFTAMVPQKQNLVDFGYDYLRTEMTFKKGQDIPEHVVYDTYALKKIQVLEEPCEGCAMGCPGQRDHMECPGGCQHNRQACDDCYSKD